jgi:hypothetical protein
MVSKNTSRREARKRGRVARKRWRATILSIGGVLLAAALLILWIGQQKSQAAFDFAPESVSYEQPLLAVHEMGNGPAIPFLPRDDPQPEILISDRDHDFGVIGSTDKVAWDFVITNVGVAPLTISRAYTTCGCTEAEFSSSVIPPGMVSLVTVQLDAGFHDVRGHTVRRGVIIENNDPDRSTMEVWIQATVR